MRSGFAAEGKGVRASRYSRSCQLSFCPCLLGFFFPFLHTHSPRLTFPNPRFANKTSFAVRDLRLSADFPPVLPPSHAARGKHRQDEGWKTPDLRGVVSWRAKDFSLRHSEVDSYTKGVSQLPFSPPGVTPPHPQCWMVLLKDRRFPMQ